MIRASQILFWFGLSIAASLALYHTSDRTRQLDHQLRDTNAMIEAEQKTIHVLKAEWVYLANPARIEVAARKHLELRPTAPKQVISLNDLAEALPARNEPATSVAVIATPMPTIKTSMAMPPRPVEPPVRKIAVAVIESGHINDRMIMQRTASAQPTDQIGALIDELGTRR